VITGDVKFFFILNLNFVCKICILFELSLGLKVTVFILHELKIIMARNGLLIELPSLF